ncbi:replicative DNA helicase [Nonomuraea rosea]|uniref:DNA 5'-3' helicase n=1 Tax=Nonomuraea rosea TaxID=638574 RepID=A0ABP6WIG8_9ACTN
MSIDVETGARDWRPSPGIVAAEMAVAGAAIQARAVAEEAAELVAADDFYSPAGIVYAAALALADDGKPVDPAAVLGVLAADGNLERVGAGAYLHTLMQHAAVPSAVSYHARQVAADARRRRINLACRQGQQVSESAAWDDEADPDLVRKLIDEAAVKPGDMVDFDVAGEMAALLDDLETPPPAPTGVVPPFQDLAHLLGTFGPGQLIVVGARQSVGKSTLAVDFLRRAAIRDGKLSAMFTLEMRRREVLQRMASAESGVGLHGIRANQVGEGDLERMVDAASRISGAPLIIDDRSGCSLEHIRSTLRSLSRQGGAAIAVIDYLQLMTPPKAPNREQEIAGLTRGLKLMAGEFEMPIVLLSQLNREVEKRTDKRPQPSDLRESGAIEQDADVIILLHREDALDRESPRAGEADLIVAKNRNGPTATITVAHQLHYSRFVDMAWTPTRGLS